jgi:hypothetical protein
MPIPDFSLSDSSSSLSYRRPTGSRIQMLCLSRVVLHSVPLAVRSFEAVK